MSSFALLCTDDCNVVLLNAGRYTAVAGPWNVVNRKTEKINNDGGMMMCPKIEIESFSYCIILLLLHKGMYIPHGFFLRLLGPYQIAYKWHTRINLIRRSCCE